jgi:AcrR family transcriptional regulator
VKVATVAGIERNKRHADRRDLLLSTGMELFSRYGYREVNISDVARSAGLSVGTFYNYFGSKEDFYGRVLDLIEGAGIRKANRLVSRLHSPLTKLKAVYQFTVLGLKQNQILRGVLTRDEKYIYPGLEERDRQKQSLRKHIEQLLAEIIREGTEKGVFRSSLYRDPTGMVIAIFDTLIQNIEREDFDELTGDLLQFMQRGLRRTLRLRRREERWDRRMLRDQDEEDFLPDWEQDWE